MTRQQQSRMQGGMDAPCSTRVLWLEALRILAAFLVIVNHTNSSIFQRSDPGQLTWHMSILWYYLSKLAVPLFVMISGALLLKRRDGLKKTAQRVARVLAALVCASYVYFLYDAWVNWGLWPRAIRLDILLSRILRMEITDGFWYLYFYLALLVTMPLWQRLRSRMSARQRLWLVAACFVLGAGLPLAGHYIPWLRVPEHIMACLPVSYIGLLFAGDLVCSTEPAKRMTVPALALLLGGLLVAWLLTWVEYARVPVGTKYWFMDHRMIPALPVICEALGLMLLARGLGREQPERPGTCGRVIAGAGGCAFGIYLLQDLLIAESRYRLFEPLCTVLPPMAAVLVWEVLVFLAALVPVWLVRRIPFARKIL